MGTTEDNDGPVDRDSTFRLWIHRGNQGIDTTSPELSLEDWNDFRCLVRDQASDSAFNAWAGNIGGPFGTWWFAHVEPQGSRWISRFRTRITNGHLAPP